MNAVGHLKPVHVAQEKEHGASGDESTDECFHILEG